MGESVCLVRSFSQPASRDETNEVVPCRVLTESVSFGRFASESLQWEKWSAFTQNRYLEEVERFTKPGSVAQKTAFFEAHFKNRAAKRATQTEIEKPVEVDTGRVMSGDVSNAEVVPSISVIDSEEPLVADNGTAMDEVTLGDVSNAEVDSVALSVGQVKVTNVQSSTSMALVPQGEVLIEEKATSLRKERRPSSSGSKTCGRSSKLEPSFVIGLEKTIKEPPSRSKRSSNVSKNQNRPPPEPFNMSINCAPSGNTVKDIAEIPQDGSRSSINAKGAGKADKTKRSGPSSVHMSVNIASSARQTNKSAATNLARNSTKQETTSSNARNSVFPSGNEQTGVSKSRKRPLSRTAAEGLKAAKCPTRASAIRLSEFPPSNSRISEDKRKKVTGGSGVSSRIPNNVQRQASAGSENFSTHSRTKAKSITVSSPFNFRSDERAEKRKEFFKKLEEKNKKEDAAKEQLSSGFKPNKNTHLASEEHRNPQVGGSKVVTSPRFCRNQTSGTENIKKSHQSFHKVSSVNAAIDKHKQCKIHPSQTKKKTQENSSPNVLKI